MRELDTQRAVAAFFVGAFVAAVAFADGGYVPDTWNWTAAGALGAAAAALATYERVRVNRRAVVFVAALAAFALWSAVSLLWTISPSATATDVQRGLTYVAVAAAVVVLVPLRSAGAALTGVLAAIVTVAAVSLWSGLIGDERTADRLAGPVGYWNGLGLLAAFGLILAPAVAAHANDVRIRAMCFAGVPILAATLYLTFSRSAWIALGVGLAGMLVLTRRPSRLVAVVFVHVAAAAITIALTTRVDGIAGSPGPFREGRVLAFALVVLAVAAAATSAYIAPLEGTLARVRVSRIVVVATLAALAVAFVVFAVRFVPSAYDAFRAPVPAGPLRSRLTSFSGNGRSEYWRVAWVNARAHPWLGSGAGTYELAWHRERRVDFEVRDAHNLYLESLSELGPIGVVLIVGALVVVLASVRRTDVEPLAAASAVFAAYIVHAALDWDWELPVATIVAIVAAAIVVGSAGGTAWVLSRRARRTLAAVAALAIVPVLALYVGNRSLRTAYVAQSHGDDAGAAENARRAAAWQPWSIEPQLVLGGLDVRNGRPRSALRRFRTAAIDEPEDWRAWRGIAAVASRAEAAAARRRVAGLNPRAR